MRIRVAATLVQCLSVIFNEKALNIRGLFRFYLKNPPILPKLAM